MKLSRLYRYFLIIMLCFVIDSTISYFLPYNYTRSSMTIVPYVGMMFFTLLVKHLETPENYFFAVICGTYYAIVYSNSLAIYILFYCLIAFVRTFLIKIEVFSILESAVFCVLTISACELIVYWLMWITNMTSYPMLNYVTMRLLPTLIVNFGLSFLIYGVYNYINTEVE